ncbi:sensor histidine kinase [Occultella kanbiaonis]|uniref:sensor histidine kinase n=1 Tax=Occultella kanbiaonis TaxID=2675754 RepID=UPI0013D4EC80|nr:sensor histidine kinase [Occultella kanbiaonis]
MSAPAQPPVAWTGRVTPNAVDAVFAGVALLFVGLPSLAFAVAMGYPATGAAVGGLASLVMPVAIGWRRSHPVHSSVVVYAAALAHVLAGAPLIFADSLIFVALYSVTVYGPMWARRTALGSALLGCLILSGYYAATSGQVPMHSLVVAGAAMTFLSALVMITWAIAMVRKARVDQIESLADRAARLEVERDQQAKIATAAERARIAREMHDIVAHSLSVVIAQADGGRYAASADPEAATRALTTISETGRAALADMRRILGVLRSDDPRDGDLIPQPDDSDLDTLAEHVRDTGLQVSVVRVGEARALPPGAGLTVYRIAQEALTNILKHAGPGVHATLLVQWTPIGLVLQIDDDGRGAAATTDGAGHGLLGMRERTAMLGGTLTTGPRPGGGYRVRAEIPLPGGRGPRPAPSQATAPLTPVVAPPPAPGSGPARGPWPAPTSPPSSGPYPGPGGAAPAPRIGPPARSDPNPLKGSTA